MKLEPGARLGPYEIVAPLGAGGMGEVYAARDTRLGRTVAIKTLPAELADDAKLKVRFEHEAKTISALNHPNICALYDVGPDYLVMEHCEGKTLAKRIAQGPLPTPQVIEYGMQIADALEKAHRAGIVHRDLKPSNVMLTKSGVKLLDFGLARQTAAASAEESTVLHLTGEGRIAGTVQYMAPELLHGHEADARSDVFALGLVLYEMAAGRPAFHGTSRASIIAAILERDPPRLDSSAPLDRLIRACLARDPDERMQSAGDVKLGLRWLVEESPATAQPGPLRRGAFAAIAAVAVFAAFAAATVYFRRAVASPEPPARTGVLLPQGVALSALWDSGAIALSPDGSRLAMIVGPAENTSLAVYDFYHGRTNVLDGTATASYPFWSPDGRRIGFFANGKLQTIGAGGDGRQIVCDAPSGRGGAWGSRGVIVFAPAGFGTLAKVSEGGGTPVPATERMKAAKSIRWTHRNPVFLPDGKTFLYIARDYLAEGKTLRAASIDGGLDREIVTDASNAVFAEGRLLFVRNGSLVAQEFDPEALEVRGTAVPIVDRLDYFGNRDVGNFSAAGGTLVYVLAVPAPRQLIAFDPETRNVQPLGQPGEFRLFDLTRDGRRAAIAPSTGGDLAIMDLERGVTSRATFSDAAYVTAVFSPDGNRLASYVEPKPARVQIQSLDATSAESVLDTSLGIRLDSWSPDGRILMMCTADASGRDIQYLPIGSGKLVPLLHGPADEIDPALSPDGRWLAYTSTESGTPQIYVTPFPELGRKWQVSSDTGTAPLWSHDGRRIFFLSRRKLHVVAVGGGPSFGPPKELPVEIDRLLPQSREYAVTPDGKIVMTRPVGDPVPRSVHVIANWRGLLRAD